jgi:hypothetical protein
LGRSCLPAQCTGRRELRNGAEQGASSGCRGELPVKPTTRELTDTSAFLVPNPRHAQGGSCRQPTSEWRVIRSGPYPRLPHRRVGDFSLMWIASGLPTMRSESSGHRGLLQPQFLHSLRQVLVIDLEDNLKAIIRSRKDIGSGVLAIYRLACASIETHIPDHFYQRVLRVQRRCCERVDVRGHQSSRPKEFFTPGKNFQKVFFLHALNTRWPTKHEDLSITSRNLLHVKYRVCRLVAGEERFYLGILVAHPSHDSTFFGAQEGPSIPGDGPTGSWARGDQVAEKRPMPACGAAGFRVLS